MMIGMYEGDVGVAVAVAVAKASEVGVEVGVEVKAVAEFGCVDW